MKTIRENGLDKKKKRNELWRIKTELVYFFKRNNRVTSLYTDSGPSIDITLPLFKILDKNSISWLDLFTFEVCSFINHEFAGNRFYGFGDCPALPLRCNDEIQSNNVDIRYDFDLGATDHDILVFGRHRCRCDTRCTNPLHMEQMFAVHKDSEQRDWQEVPRRHECYENWVSTKCGFISPKFLVAVGVTGDRPVSKFPTHSKTVIELYDFNNFFQTLPLSNVDSKNLPQWKVLNTNLPDDILNASLVTTDANEMYLIGGFIYDHESFKAREKIEDIFEYFCEVTNRVFKGTFSKNTQDVRWTEVESLIRGRAGHISFKMGNNIYVVGGYAKNEVSQTRQIKRSRLEDAVIQRGNWVSSCERYDLLQHKWTNCPYGFPPIMIKLDDYRVSCDFLNVTVSGDEKTAIITGKEELNNVGNGMSVMISFTEENGFIVHESDTFRSLRSKPKTPLATHFESPYTNAGCTHISLCLDTIS